MQINPSAAHPVVMSAIKKVECQIHSQVPIQELPQQAVCETTNLGCLYRLWEAGGPGGLAGPDVIPPGPTSIARGVLAIASTVGLLGLVALARKGNRGLEAESILEMEIL